MIPDIKWEKPLTINNAFTYKNMAWRSDTDYAVQINAGNQQINFENCTFAGGAECIVKGWGGTKVKFTNCSFYGVTPVDCWARAFNGYEVMGFEMYNCYTEHTGGILIEKWIGPADAPLKVMYNQFRNIDTRRKDGSRGNLYSGLMIKNTSSVALSNCEIGWNETINEFGNSYVEDNYNFFNAKGTPDKPIYFHDNYVYGAFPAEVGDASYTGTGCTTDGDGQNKGFDQVTSYIRGENNIFLECQNSAINIAIGHHINYRGNIIMNSGLAPDGQKFKKAWAGCAIFDSNLTAQSDVNNPVFSNNVITGNTIGSMSWGQNYPYKDRQDEMDDRGTGQWQNRMPRGGNTYLPEGSVTPAAVAAIYPAIWQSKLKDNGITIGVGGSVAPAVTDLTLKLTQTALGTLTPKNKAGQIVPFTATSVSVTITDPIATATVSSAGIKVVPVKSGKTTITVNLKTLAGAALTKSFTMEILAGAPAPDNEAVDLVVNWVVS